jgi:predicted dehydrogenase
VPDRIKTAVIGAGVFGGRHAEKHAACPDAELVAVVDPDPARREALAAKVGARALADIADLPPDVRAASVATPTSTHFEVARALMARGIAVLVEKPLADRLDHAEALAAEAERRGLVLQVGHIERFSPAFAALAAKVTRPLFIESQRIAPFSGRSADVDVVLDLMIHDIDLLLSLVRAPLEAVEAVGAPVLTDREDIANARLRFADGCVANVTASRIAFKTERKIRIFQPSGYITADLSALTVRRIFNDAGGFRAEEESFERGDALAAEVAAFLAAVRGEASPPVTGRDGVEAVRAALAIGESLRAHRARIETLLAGGAEGGR